MPYYLKTHNTYSETGKYSPHTGKKARWVPERAQILDLLDKHFKLVNINVFKEWKEFMSKELKYENDVLPNREY